MSEYLRGGAGEGRPAGRTALFSVHVAFLASRHLTFPGWLWGSSCSASSRTPATARRRSWRVGPTARSSRCPGCCTWWPPRSTAPAARTTSRELVSEDLGRSLGAEQVRYLITAKLLPLGLIAGPGAPAAPPKASPLLALRARGTLLPERAANAVAVLLRPLFRWPAVLAVVVSVAAVDYWLFATRGPGRRARAGAAGPGEPAHRVRPVGGLRGVPRVRARDRLPLRRRAARRDRRRHLPGLALVLHQRHRLLPARPRRPHPHRPRRPVLQPHLHPGHGRTLRGDLGRGPPPRHRRHAPGDAAAAAPVRPLRRLLHPQRPGRRP